jgi:hypothetical protein
MYSFEKEEVFFSISTLSIAYVGSSPIATLRKPLTKALVTSEM